MSRLESFIELNTLDEEWNIKPTSTTSGAMFKYRGEEFKTLVFIYLPKLNMFIHMRSDTGDVYVDSTKIHTIKDPDYRHHDSIALTVMREFSEFEEYDAADLYESDNILETLEDDFDSVRGFCYKNDIYIYPVGGALNGTYKSKAIMRLKIYIDDYWWEK